MDKNKPETVINNQKKFPFEYLQRKRDETESDNTNGTNEDLGIIIDNEQQIGEMVVKEGEEEKENLIFELCEEKERMKKLNNPA
jgi:hypothetical protein